MVEAGGRRIGVTHGARTKAVELPAAALSLLAARAVLLGFDRAMRRRFGDVDCVVVGHLHMPIHRMVDGALLFSPGAVYVPELDPGYSWSSLKARGYRRFRDRLPPRRPRARGRPDRGGPRRGLGQGRPPQAAYPRG